MILLLATLCLQADPVTVECKTVVWRMDKTPAACVRMIAPVQAFITEQAAGFDVVKVLAACKMGIVA